MNKLLSILILASYSAIGLAQSETPLATNHYAWSAQTVTADGRVRVTITKHKPKVHLAKLHRPIIKLSVDDDDTDYYDELPDFQIGYRRPELVDQTAQVQDDISDEIKIRLLLARKRALEAYTRKWV